MSRRLPSRPVLVRRLSLAVAAVVAATLTANGQVRFRVGVGVGPLGVNSDLLAPDGQPHGDTDAPVGVTVPDSPGAVERLNQAAEKEHQKEWKTAADFYREAVAKFPGRVVPAKGDKAAGAYRFVGVAAAVQERIARWPADGLAVYRNLYGPAAADRLANAPRGDLATPESVFFDDFVTDAGKAAGLRLIDAYTEAGDFPAAAAVGTRMLDLHPTLGSDRPAILFRTALALHWAGDDAAAAKRLGDLRTSDPKATGSIGGKDVVLADALAAAVAVPPARPAVDPVAADTYPSFGGPGGRGDVSPSTAKPGASRTSVELTPPDFAGLQPAARANWVQQDGVSLANGGARGIIPVVDAGTLFFQDGRTVYAVDPDSGMPAPGWLATYPGDANGRYRYPAPGRARGEQLTVTVAPSAVLAVMGQRDRAQLANGMFGGGINGGVILQQPDGTSSPIRLVCLDRATGRELWKATPAELPDAAGAAKQGEYGGTPLAVPAAVAGAPDDAVLTIVRGGRDGQFDNGYVVCLSARTGQFRWATYVGSGTRTFDGDNFFSQDPSQLALADGRVVVMSNLGTIAALDPADGRVLWLDAYPRENAATDLDAIQRQQMGGGPAASAKPWVPNPVIVQGGRVFALPTDTRQLMILDAATGAPVKRINTAVYGNADVLLGVRQQPAVGKQPAADLLILTNEQHVLGVDWRAYAPDGDPTAAVRFSEEPVSSDVDDKGPEFIAGRGFLTADSILVTTRHRLFQYGWRRGNVRLMATYPPAGVFDKAGGEEPGNVLATSQNVVVAGQTRATVYSDMAVVAAKYDRQMADAPADPAPRVRYATALFSGGQTADAIARLDEAMDLAGGRRSMRPGPARDGIFNVLLDFTRRLSPPVPRDQSADAKVLDSAAALFDRAADAADGPDQRVRYLLARARFDHDVAHDYAGEVELGQQILSDPALRQVAVTEEQTAAAAATAAVAVAANADPSAYAPVEARAAAALADARTKGDADALLAVADVYPNSRAADDARQAAVDQYQRAGKPALAIGVLRQLYAAAADPAVKGTVLERVAVNFLAQGPDGVGPAVDRLCRAAELSPDPHLAYDLPLPGGSPPLRHGQATYADAVGALRGTLAAADAAKLPDLHLPSYTDAVAAYAASHNGVTLRQAVDDYIAAHPNEPAGAPTVSPFRPDSATLPDVTALVHPPTDFGRTDRLVTWSASTGLAVFDAGQTTPRFRAADVSDPPLGAAWVGSHGGGAGPGRWVVWTAAAVSAVTDDGRPAWPAAVTVRGLPSVPPVAPGEAVVFDIPGTTEDDTAAAQQQAAMAGQVVNVRVAGGRRVFIIRGNRLVPAPVAPPAAAAAAGGEQLTAVQPAGPDGATVVAVTSAGRVLAVDTTTGRALWQSRPADRPADALLANAHFTIVRLDDPAGDTLVVYETPTGRVVGRGRFGPDNTPGQLVNVALGEEGSLALTLGKYVMMKDLYDPWREPLRPLGVRATNQDGAPFTTMTGADQLLVRAGRVAALYDAGRYVRAYDLARPLADPTNPLATAAASPAVSLRLVGPQLFVVQPANVKRFNLDDPSDTSREMLSSNDYHVRGLLLGSDFAVVVDDPVDRGPNPSPEIQLLAVSRAPIPGRAGERDDIQFTTRKRSASGIADWVGVDGGLYLLTGDHRLHAFRGGRP